MVTASSRMSLQAPLNIDFSYEVDQRAQSLEMWLDTSWFILILTRSLPA